MSRFLNDLIPYPNGELGRRKGDRRKKSAMQLVLRKGDRWKKSAKQLVLRKGDRRKKWLVFGWKVVGKKIKSSQAKKKHQWESNLQPEASETSILSFAPRCQHVLQVICDST